METSIYFCPKALLWSVMVLIACMICMAVDNFVSYRLSALFILVPCAASMTYLALLKITDQQNKIADLKRELEEVKEKQL